MEPKLDKAERTRLIRQLSMIELENCDQCERVGEDRIKTPATCDGCPVYEEIKIIGAKLDPGGGVIKKRRQRNKGKPRTFIKDVLTPAKYYELKDQNKSDLEICDEIGFANAALTNWKKENNIVHRANKYKHYGVLIE